IAGADGAPIDPVVAAGWAGRPIELPVLGAESSAGWTIVYTDPAQWRAADGSGAHAFGASAVVHNVFCRVAVPPPSALPKDS
ncbi:MAG: hypothetical protein ABI780_09110, partial [Ardenticatenales bacterium]